MRITIAQRLMPFTHTPGSMCILPGTSLQLQVFPALIRVFDLSKSQPVLVEEITQSIKGPVEKFTIQLNLEESKISVWGNGADGFFRYHIVPSNNSKGFQILNDKERYKGTSTSERLSLGNHKAQDWDRVVTRKDLTEIFPIWMRLGQCAPPNSLATDQGTAAFLEKCHTKDIKPFLNLFQAGFEGILSPRLNDESHLGFDLPAVGDSGVSPLILLTEGAKRIRALFLRESPQLIEILPNLPVEFHSGRFINIRTAYGVLDMEWSKKAIRRLIFRPEVSTELQFAFPKEMRQCRVRKGNRDKGQEHNLPLKLEIETNQIYYFDNFKH